MTDFVDKKLSSTIATAIKSLIAVEHFIAGSIVTMPNIYPSGASVVLEISMQGGRVFVSDRGGGFQEAEFLGSTRQYSKEAAKIAADAGIEYNGRDMFVTEVPSDAIAGAMAIVASCSSNAACLSAFKAAERDERDARDTLFDRLSDVYGANGFEKDVPIIGSSNHQWRVDAVVKRSQNLIIFNSVTKSYVSAAGTAAKFHDFARLEIVPRRISVVRSIKELGDWIGVVGPASDAVIEMNAANDQFYKLVNSA